MNKIIIIAAKEIRELLHDKRTIGLGVVFAFFFGIMYSLRSVNSGGTNIMPIDSTLFFLAAAIGFFMAYISTGQVFLREKSDKVIETLLCAPVNLRHIWLGKVIAVAGVSYGFALLSSVIAVAVPFIADGYFTLPGAAVIFHILPGIFFFITAIAGLLGFIQLLLGMRENRILNFVIFAPVFGLLYGSGYALGSSFTVSWLQVLIPFALSLILLVIAAFLVRHLNKERVVTTIN